MKRLKLILVVCAIYIVTILSVTTLSNYLDEQFYGKGWKENRLVYAKKVKKDEVWNKDIQKVIGPNGKEYEVKIIAYIPKIDDEPKLIRVHDPEFDVYCYTNQNDPYYMITGLNCYPKWILEGGNGK